MVEKYQGEFGSSLHDMIKDQRLMAKWEESIPELSSLPPNEPLYFGDLCKIGGSIHVWISNTWQRIDEKNRQRWLGC